MENVTVVWQFDPVDDILLSSNGYELSFWDVIADLFGNLRHLDTKSWFDKESNDSFLRALHVGELYHKKQVDLVEADIANNICSHCGQKLNKSKIIKTNRSYRELKKAEKIIKQRENS